MGLKLKKDHVKNLADAVEKNEIKNGEKRLNFDEWKNDLKSRGIPEAEIEAVFAKYDDDGDMVLNENEQKKLRMSLERQKLELQEKIDDARGQLVKNESENSELPQPSAG